MSRVIIFCGQSGSGKSTLAAKVSKDLKVFCLHKDSIKEKLYELEQGETLEDSQRTGKQALLLCLELAEEAIKNSVEVILESPFNHPDNIKQFTQWASRGVDVRMIVCEIDEEERLRRVKERPRHHSHHDKERRALGHFKKDTFDYSLFPGKKLFLETNKPQEELVEKVMTFLRS